MIHTLCTIRLRNQRTDQGSLDPGPVHQSCMLLVSCIRPVRSRQRSPGGDVSGFTALMNVERVGWTASSWAMPSQGPTDPRVAPTKHGFAGKDTLGVQLRPRHLAGVIRATLQGPNGPAPAPLRGDSVRPPWHMATGGRSRRNTTPICTLRTQGVRGVACDLVRIEAHVPLPPRGRVTGVPMWGVSPKRDPYFSFGGLSGPGLG